MLLVLETGDTVGETVSLPSVADAEPSVGSELVTHTVTRLEPSVSESTDTVETMFEFGTETLPVSTGVPTPHDAVGPAYTRYEPDWLDCQVTEELVPDFKSCGTTDETVTTGAVGELTVSVAEDWVSSEAKIGSLPCKCPSASIAVTEIVFVHGEANVVNEFERYVAVIPSAAQETKASGSMVEPQSALKSACAETTSEQPFLSRISVFRTTASIPLEMSEDLSSVTVRTCGTTLIATEPVFVTERNPDAEYVAEKSNVLYG